MENRIVKDLVVFGIIILIAAIALSFIFSPTSDAHDTNIQLLNKGDFGSNSTVYIKLTDAKKNSLSNKTVHVKLLNKNGKAVYDKSINTHTTGVGMAKLGNVSAGEYTLNLTYDGDANYTGCSLSKKVKVQNGTVEDIIDNSTLNATEIQDIVDSQTQDQQDSQSSSQSNTQDNSQSNSNSQSPTDSNNGNDDSGYDVYYDEDGNEMTPEIDADGNQIDPTRTDN